MKKLKKHLEITSLTKRQLCSLLHNFFSPSHTLIAQTMLFSRYTWRELHDLGNIEWDIQIPVSVQELTRLTLYSFFLESSKEMPRYCFSEQLNLNIFLLD